MLRDSVNLITNGLTLAAFLYAFMVMVRWRFAFPAAMKWIRRSKHPESFEMLAIAIVFGCLTYYLDAGYWFFTWSLDFVGHPAAGDWINNGIYSNFFSRGLASAGTYYLHFYSSRLREIESGEVVPDVRMKPWKIVLAAVTVYMLAMIGLKVWLG